MATQQNDLKIVGQLGELVHFKRGEKYFSKPKAEFVTQSVNTKQSAKDFGTGVHWASIFRKAILPTFKDFTDDTFYLRCNSAFLSLISSAPKSLLGAKQLSNTNLQLLQGFQFNLKRKLADLLLSRPIFKVGENGEGLLSIKPSNAKGLQNLAFWPSAEKAKLLISILNINLDTEAIDFISPPPLEIHVDKSFPKAKLPFKLEVNGNRLILLIIGVDFWKNQAVSQIGAARSYAAAVEQSLHLRNGLPVTFEVESYIKNVEKSSPHYNANWLMEQ